jgi:hypothetical protein
MTQDFFLQPMGRTITPIEDLHIFLADGPTLFEAMQWVSGCERCSDHALIRFDYILDAVTGANPTATEYVMCRPARCPCCGGQITERTQISVC